MGKKNCSRRKNEIIDCNASAERRVELDCNPKKLVGDISAVMGPNTAARKVGVIKSTSKTASGKTWPN